MVCRLLTVQPRQDAGTTLLSAVNQACQLHMARSIAGNGSLSAGGRQQAVVFLWPGARQDAGAALLTNLYRPVGF